MSLTSEQRQRISAIEKNIQELQIYIKNGGSKNQLNRLLVLAQNQTNELKEQVLQLEEKVEELLSIARRLL